EKSHHKDQLDIKKGGIFPIMHGVRSLALENKLTHTNTIERIKILNERGVFDKESAVELIEAYAFINGIRLHAELEKVKLGQQYDNYINPNEMSKLERDLLKDAFRIVNDFKKFITHHFKLNLVS
ncbi:MAG: signal transduction protein, partial [Beggiatoa sp. IS2]